MSNKTISDRFIGVVRAVLPSPFTIAVMLTVVAFLFALITTIPSDIGFLGYVGDLSGYWYDGMWNGALLEFAVQMMLMLVLGHVLALSKPIDGLISHFTTLALGATGA
jgi:short-chain fatty acids transporter